MPLVPPRPQVSRAALALLGRLLVATASSAVFATLTMLWLAWHAQPSFSVLFWGCWVLPITLVCQAYWQGERATRFLRVGVSAVLVLVLARLTVAGLPLTVLGALLALCLVSLIASWRDPTAGQRWVLAAAYGCAAGVGVALVMGYQPGFEELFPRLLGILLPSAALIGLAGEVLRSTSPRLLPRLLRWRPARHAERVGPVPTAGISRRRMLLGAGGLMGLAATGVGCTWLTRRLLAPWLPLVTFQGRLGIINCLSWSPGGDTLVFSSFDAVYIGDPTTGKTVSTLEIPVQASPDAILSGEVIAAAWSPAGSGIAGTVENGLVIWDAHTLQVIRRYALMDFLHLPYAETTFVFPALAWSPDGLFVATPALQVYLWDLSRGVIAQTIPAVAQAIAWSPNGAYLATANLDPSLQIWDASTGALLATFPVEDAQSGPYSLTWSPDSTRLAYGVGKVYVRSWDGQQGSLLFTYQAPKRLGVQFAVNAVAWSPDGQWIASTEFDTIHVWDARTGVERFQYQGHTSWVNAVAWSPDGTLIASGGYDGTVQIWQPA